MADPPPGGICAASRSLYPPRRGDSGLHDVIDGPKAWWRLAVAVLISTIGGVGMWSVVVALPAIEAEFGVARGGASLPYTLTMLGFGVGGVLLGRVADRRGVVVPVAIGAVALGLGYGLASQATALWQFALLHGLLIGLLGSAAAFGPLIADISLWFNRRRGIAVAICASGNYLAGAIWPPVVQHFIGVGRLADDLSRHRPVLRWRRCCRSRCCCAPARRRGANSGTAATGRFGTLDLSPGALQAVLAVAGVACCVAMSMPQVHIVAYCGDLGYGVARGAQMLSLMLGSASSAASPRASSPTASAGSRTLLLGSRAAGARADALSAASTALPSLYVISALFGLFQGGIVPSYAIIVREYFPPREAGARVGIVLMATLVGMALGGWMSGAIFDLTGSYRAAFANGLAWNLLNGLLVASLLFRRRAAVLA